MGNLHRWNCDCNNKLFSYRRLFPFTLLGMESQMTLAIRQKFFNADTPSGCYNLEWYKKYKVCSDAFEDLANSWSI